MTIDINQADDVLDLDALRPSFTEDPYPVYAQLREAAPVRQVTYGGNRMWLVTRYEDVCTALADPAFSNDPRHGAEQLRSMPDLAAGYLGPLARNMLLSDPPEHTRLRKMLGKQFTARRVEALRPRIEQVSRELIERFRPTGRVELINEFAALVPIAVIMELLGAPAEDQAEFRRRSDIIINISADDLAQKPQAFAEMYAYLTDLIEQKERQREFAPTDLLGALIAMRDDEESLDHSELLSTAFLLLIAGYFTTLNLIGNGTLALIRHPEQLAALRADPSLFEKAIEEFLRYDCPITNTSNRFMTKDTELGGVTIPAGDLVLLCLGSANRDPAKFTSPDTLDIRRDASGHVAFTHGMHYCLGAPLARLEGRIAIRALLDNCADLALASGEKPQWRVSTTLQGLVRLPLTFTPVLP